MIVGTLVPDLPYFLFLGENKGIGHSLEGVFLFCLPVGMVLLWIFHAVLKRPLAALAPEFMRLRLTESDLQFRFAPTPRFALIIVSLLIGIFSHILWDGFTHEHGYFVKQWPALSTRVLTHHVMPLWHALQLGCSVLGVAAVVIFSCWLWLTRPVAREPVASDMTPRLRWFLIAVLAVVAALAGLAVGFDKFVHHRYGWRGSLVEVVITIITATAVELLLFSVAWHWNRSQAKNRKPLTASIEGMNSD
jgi:hypothetical protein